MAEPDAVDVFLAEASAKVKKDFRNRFTRHSFDKGQFIFFEGDKADGLYLIDSGVVEANIIHGDGKVFIFHFIFPGDMFGEGVLYGQESYPFSTVARKDANVFKIGKDDLDKMLAADPSFERHLLKIVGEKLDHAYMKARCIAGERVEKRVACILLKAIDEQGIMADCGEKIDTPLTNRDISGLIGSTEETVSRVMSRLKKEGIIGTENKHLVVLDRDALMRFVDAV